MTPQDIDPEESARRPLADLCGEPMEPGRFLELAVSITAALAGLHAQDLIHQNLNPYTILIDSRSATATLAASAGTPLYRHEQAPAYISPEQTGRINLPLDHRSDLYSLGVTFYQMLTASLPCVAEDLLEWVHCHIAHAPPTPQSVAPAIPAQLSDIVVKLLAKNPHERYQTATGLKWDLERCLARWRETGTIAPFRLGERDIPDRLMIPERLYGRGDELQLLLECFDRVAESGTAEMVLVAGYAGIGKTSLVRELYGPVISRRGYFISGKFDQFQRNIPYSTISQAFRELVLHLLSESEERIAQWKRAVQEAVGINGQLMVEVVPELEYLIGKQPPVTPLPQAQAQTRFNMIFQRLVSVFARREHPLVIFLDDLQWPDPSSLRLTAYLLSHPQSHYLLVIGAYRDNEVHPSHPLLVTISGIEKAQEIVRTITLPPLSLDDLGQLLAETFRSEKGRVEPLTRLTHEKTGGNPFFAVQFLKSLYEEGLVRFDAAELLWKWDVEAIRDRGYTDNIADLMVAKLRKLPEGVIQVMRLAACIGNRFDLRTLALICQQPQPEVREALEAAVAEGLLLQGREQWLFLHDRIQEAAYSLVPEDDRPGLHLRIGRLMLSQLPPEEVEARVLDVVSQLNLGEQLMTSTEERDRVAELNLLGARRAKASTAYHSALHYLQAGQRFLSGDVWERRGGLAFAIELLIAECEFLTGELEPARERLTSLLERDLTLVERSEVTCLLIDLFVTGEGRDPAVDAGLRYLGSVGVQWQAHPDAETVRQEFARMWRALGERSREELIELPLMTDPERRAVMDVLTRLIPPTLHTDAHLFSLVVCRMVELSVEYGNSDGSCLAYVWLGNLLGPQFGDYSAACHFANLGLEILERRGLDRYKPRVYLDYSHAEVLLNRPLRTGPDLVRRALQVAEERGDLTFMAYSSCNLISALLSAGRPLAEIQQEAEERLEFAKQARFGLIADIIIGQLGLVRLLRGLNPDFQGFERSGIDEAAFERHLEEDPGMAVARSWYWARKLQGLYYLGDFVAALHAAEKTREVLWTIPSHVLSAEYEFFAALACCAYYPSAPPSERPPLLAAVRQHLATHRQWEALFPDNFADRAALIAAELARIEKRELEAEQFYEEALRKGRKSELLHNEALAYELLAGFYRGRGFATFADTYQRLAISRYRAWGAQGKVRQLNRQGLPYAVAESGAAIGELDAITIVRASQAISQQIRLANLLDTLLRMVLENAGAQQGCLLLVAGEELSVAAKAQLDGGEIEVRLEPQTPLCELVPVSMANFVRRTRDKVILDDARRPNRFSPDAYLELNQPVSVLCLPVSRQSEIVGILYLENDLVEGAFTADRIAVLEALAAQAAISLENSRLYMALQESELKYRELSQGLELRVNEALQELREKNRMMVLQSRQAIMGEMLGNIAHQWRQPLNTLALLAQELQMTRKFKTLTDEMVDANLKKTMEIIKHMSRTIDDFRYFYKPEKEKVQFRLLDVLEKTLSLLEGTLHAYQIEVETVAEADPVLEGYPNEYSQVLLNIINNAKDAFLSRGTPKPRIVIRVARAAGRSVITIADNAGGIAPEIIDNIFELYFTTKGPEQGTGVGLFMCKSIIEKNMHGSLTVRNTGEGAEFRIEV